MNLRQKSRPRVYLIAILFLTLGVGANGQEAPKAVLVDEFGNLPCDDLLGRLDHFAYEVSKDKGSSGFAVIFPGDNVFENIAYERAIRNNSAFRSFPKNLVRTILTKRKGTLKLELWKIPDGGPLVVSEVPTDYKLPVSKRTRFVDDSVEVIKFEGKPEIVRDGCISSFSLDVLSKVLEANSDLAAEIVIFNKRRTAAQTLSSLIRKAAISETGIQKNRLKIIYGGAGIAKRWDARVSAIEIWLMPTKRK